MRRYNSLQSLTVGALLAMTAACGGTSDTQQQVATVPFSQAPDQYVSAYCSGYASCCATKGFTFSASACDANVREFVTSSFCTATSIFDATAAAQCFADLQASNSACQRSVYPSEACLKMCLGTQPAGGTCVTSSDCAQLKTGPALCANLDGSSLACMVVATHGVMGSHCDVTCRDAGSYFGQGCTSPTSSSVAAPAHADVCFTDDGLYCAYDNTCQSTIALGGSCGSIEICQSNLQCDHATALCAEKSAIGATCAYSADCIDNAYCTLDGICANRKAAGEPCSGGDECLGACPNATNQCEGTGYFSLNVNAADCANPSLF